VDLFYSVEKFQAAYAQLIPALDDKSQWPKSNHGFFMHPPLLKSVAGRRQVQRFKSCTRARIVPQERKGKISALFVKVMATIDIIVRMVTLMILRP
jgi:hypothetical protein